MVLRASGHMVLTGLSASALVLGAMLPAQAAPQPVPTPDGWTATQLEPTQRVQGAKSASSRLAQTDPELLARTDSAPVTVMIKLDYDPTASYSGGVDGLAATSPSVTGQQLTGESQPEKAYADFQQRREDAVVTQLKAKVPSASVGPRLRTVYGGIAATIPADTVETVLGIDGVTAVQRDELRQLLTDSSPAFLNAPPVYESLGGTATAGEGVIYGNLDSGVWPEHPSFADLGNLKPPPGLARACDFGENPLTPEDDPFACNNKLIGGQAFLKGYLSDPARAAAEPFKTARDSNGHGTHTASTSVGNVVDDVSVLGTQLAPQINGLAPGAWLMEYKVCGIAGCVSSDSVAAIEQAVADGVDVINYSISGGTNPFTDPVELAFLDAYAAGVFVSTSAGNDGPGAATAEHLSPWVTTVGASTQSREFATTLTLTSADGATASFEGASITPGVGPLPVVLSSAAPYSDPLCQKPAPAGTFTGMIVACQRGLNARVDKGYNVLQGGAAAMVLYNPALADVETDTHWLPAVHLADGTDFLAFMSTHTGVTGSFPAGSAQQGQGDVMAAFSSRGPAGNFIKPDVTAPGVEILAGDTPVSEGTESGPEGEYFQAIAGTSMSSPHVAGAAILLRALHPQWTPGQIKSALMTTSVTGVVKQDLTTPADPFDMGAGRIDIGLSAVAPLTLDETPERFAALGNNPVTAVDLNLPSINAPVMPGRLTTTRTVTSTSDSTASYTVSAQAPAGSTITVSPSRFSVRPGRSVELKITITSEAPIGEQQFGTIQIAGASTRQQLPVAFVHTQGVVSLSQTCNDASIERNSSATCTVQAVNGSFDERTVDLDSSVTRGVLRVTAARGATVVDRQSVRQHDVRLAGAKAGVPSVDAGGLFGYQPLANFGIEAQPIGDEEIIDVDVPEFVYNGERFTRIGVDSNGYLVAGGATSEDNQCCNLPDGPSAARPNNVLAPFWTDLDGTAAPGVRVAALSDGTSRWVVVEWQVKVFGTSDLRTFQAWLGTDGNQDITFAYPAEFTDPNDQPFLVGAENARGEGDMEAALPTTDLRVTSTEPVPGASYSYSYTVRGTSPGTGVATTTMRADGVPGITVVDTAIVVSRR